MSGNPKTARAPAATACSLNAAQRVTAGSARSGSTTGWLWRYASTHGPSPSVNCSSSIVALTSFVVHTEPCGCSSIISMIPAPVISVTSAQTTHRRVVDGLPWASPARRVRMRSNRSSGTLGLVGVRDRGPRSKRCGHGGQPNSSRVAPSEDQTTREPVVVTIMPENLGAATHDADTTAGRLPVMGVRDAFALVGQARGSSDHIPAPDVWSVERGTFSVTR